MYDTSDTAISTNSTESSSYLVVRKVHATHILLNRRKVIIAFIEGTDIRWQPQAASRLANFVFLYKKTPN